MECSQVSNSLPTLKHSISWKGIVYELLRPTLGLKRRRQWHPTPVLLPGKSHGRRSMEGCSPWGRWESDTTERLHFHYSLSCIGEGNGNPLQCSCLENPRDGGAWWAAVCGIAQSGTRLKRLSSSMFLENVEMSEPRFSSWFLSCLLNGSPCWNGNLFFFFFNPVIFF